jgi:hypothetical protein
MVRALTPTRFAGAALCLVLVVAGCSSEATTEPVPAPIETEPPSVAVRTAPAVSIGTTTTLSDGVRVLVSGISTVKVRASGPGDVAGDGVAVQLTVQNSSEQPFDLSGLAITAFYGQAQPASPGGVGDLLTGPLETGEKARGVYVFTVPTSKVPSVQVQVSSSTSAVIAVYKNGSTQ